MGCQGHQSVSIERFQSLPAKICPDDALLTWTGKPGNSLCLFVKKGIVMQSNRCRHYQLETEYIPVPGVPVMLGIPVRRCHLAEHMIERLAASDNGVDIARKLMFPAALASEAGATPRNNALPENLLIRAAFGPDLEPIHHEDCIVQRCVGSCTPGYIALLEQVGITVDPDHAVGKGCQEPDEVTEDAL